MSASMLNEYDTYVDTQANIEAWRSMENETTMLGCAGTCVKNTLLIMNVFFLLFGAACIGLGAYTLNSSISFIKGSDIAIGVIVIGSCMVVIACLGCCGAMWKSRFFLSLYSIILLLTVIAQVVVVTFLFMNSSFLEENIESGWKSASESTQEDIQIQFTCCGLDTYNDTYAFQPCPTEADESCLDIIVNKLSDNLMVTAVIGAIMVFAQIFGVIFSCSLIVSLARAQKRATPKY